jgi:hypothetical protein
VVGQTGPGMCLPLPVRAPYTDHGATPSESGRAGKPYFKGTSRSQEGLAEREGFARRESFPNLIS